MRRRGSEAGEGSVSAERDRASRRGQAVASPLGRGDGDAPQSVGGQRAAGRLPLVHFVGRERPRSSRLGADRKLRDRKPVVHSAARFRGRRLALERGAPSASRNAWNFLASPRWRSLGSRSCDQDGDRRRGRESRKAGRGLFVPTRARWCQPGSPWTGLALGPRLTSRF